MRDKTHIESLERWAHFVKENPHTWKKSHTAFIDAQFMKSRQFLKRLSKTPSGKEKIRQLQALKMK